MKKKKKLNLNKIILMILVIILVAIPVFSGSVLDMLLNRYSSYGLICRAMPVFYKIDKNNNDLVVEVSADEHQSDINAPPEISFEALEIEEGISEEIKIELLKTKSQNINLSGDKPKILIYSTHATEAYTPTDKMPYKQTDKWRTDDNDKNIIAVAAALSKELNEKYGICTLHDTTDYEPPVLGTSYTRSIVGMQNYLEKYPSLELFIDIHRDAYESKNKNHRDVAMIGDKPVAKVMFVVGTGEGKTGAGFSKKPNYKENYALALAISENLKTFSKDIARPIRIKDGRYNQHIDGRALLIEIGHNENTLEEALASVPYIAESIAKSAKIN